MRSCVPHLALAATAIVCATEANAQQAVTITGNVKNKSQENLAAVSVTIKGSSTGTFTDDKGNFRLTTAQPFPFTLVFSSIGYAAQEVTVNSATALNISLETSFDLGQEVVVSASRTPERILESPVTIERVSANTIRQAPASSYYDVVGNLKGVDVVTSSFTFRTPTTRGFSGSGNLRLNQLVDGMDNQAPGLNFSVGSVIGLTELDVDNMELLAGASSALYGSGGMNGTLLINSKNPFRYPGFSAQVKQGVTHVDNYQRKPSPFYDWSVRWAKTIGEKFAFKIGGQFIQTRDWVGNDRRNYLRSTSTTNPFGNEKAGDRTTDPNYDGVNVYGDETTSPLSGVYNGVVTGLGASGPTIVGATTQFLTAQPTATIAQYNAFLNSIGASAVVASGLTPVLYGGNPARNYFGAQSVSRTGYNEIDVINPNTVNFKVNGGLYYKLRPDVELSLTGVFGTGNTVYTGSDRYALQDLKMAQYKLELKGKDFYLRAYTTQENSGGSYNATITTRIFNEQWKASTTWYPQYAVAYATARAAGAPDVTAHTTARTFADQGRPTGNIYANPLYQQVANTPISRGGGLFLDRSDLYVGEGSYNFTRLLGLQDKGTDVLVGANYKEYWLNSAGTLFADTSGSIGISEVGAYIQVQQKLFGDILKITAAGRYDKNENFKGRFTPRVTAVVKVAKDHNVRASYQMAYRFPSTQNQWINLVVGNGTFLIGGLPQLRQFYKIDNGQSPVYTQAAVERFGQAFAANVISQGGNPANPTPAQAAIALGASQGQLQAYTFNEYKAEVCNSIEVGYKGTWFNRILVDVYGYRSTYQNFIGSVNLLQSLVPGAAAPLGLLNSATGAARTRNIFSTTVNATEDVVIQGYGASLEYRLPKNFSFGANFFSDEMVEKPTSVEPFFNAPKYRYNLMLANSGFAFQKRAGFSINYRWQDDFNYIGTFGQGIVPAFNTVDAAITYRFPAIKSMFKVGGTNILNKYYRSAWGNPEIGALYYVSFGYNVF